jgi:hypothetical protein
MNRRERLVVRLLRLALLLLAVSPLTAPFSTCDPLDLFGGGATVPAPTSIQAKSVSDEPAVEIGSPVGLVPVLLAGGSVQAWTCRGSQAVGPLDIPLRL